MVLIRWQELAEYLICVEESQQLGMVVVLSRWMLLQLKVLIVTVLFHHSFEIFVLVDAIQILDYLARSYLVSRT